MGVYCVAFAVQSIYPPVNYVAVTASEENVYFGGRLVGKRAPGNYVGTGVVSDFTADRLQSKGDGSKFYPYGESRTGAAGDDKEQFATYTRDAGTGLDYADQRMYASGLGRFLQADPFKGASSRFDPSSWNQFAYTRNNPSSRIDPQATYDQDPDDPFNCMVHPEWCVFIPPGPGFPAVYWGFDPWVYTSSGTILFAAYNDSIIWGSVHWGNLASFAASQSLPMP